MYMYTLVCSMANLKSSKKDIRRTLKRTKANSSQKSRVRTYLRKAKEMVAVAKTYQEGMEAVVAYEKNAMISTKNHLFSKKAVARMVSKLVTHLKVRFQQSEQVFAKAKKAI